jgi:nucleotide-binding universal stress UspA family protein
MPGKKGEKRMHRSIICGVDGSTDSQAALAVAIDLAARLRLRLVMANVVEPSQSPHAGAAAFKGAMSQPRRPTTDQQEVANGRV